MKQINVLEKTLVVEKKMGLKSDYERTEAMLNELKASTKTPDIDSSLGFFVEAFSRLTHSRSISQGDSTGINWLAINEWCKRYEIDGEYFDFFQDVMYTMDNAYLQYRAESIEKQLKSGNNK